MRIMRSLLLQSISRRVVGVGSPRVVVNVGGSSSRCMASYTMTSSSSQQPFTPAVQVVQQEPTKTSTTITTPKRSFASLAGGYELSMLKEDNPHVDVVKYKHKNRVWTVHHVDYYSEALAIGLLENGLQTGDVVLSWLPSHFSEQMVLQFACSKAGFILYTLDPALATTDPIASQQALEAALKLTKANVLISQEAGSDVNYVRLAAGVIPEVRIFDYGVGMPFVTPRFPDLRFCIHTGFDQDDKHGWLLLRHMIVPSGNLDQYVPNGSVTATTPLAGELILNDKGIPTSIGKTLTNEQVVKGSVWPTYTKILNKEFHQVEGVGVIF